MKAQVARFAPALLLAAGLGILAMPGRASAQEVFVGAGISVLRPFYDHNPAYVTLAAPGVGAIQQTEEDLSWNMGVAPKVWAGVMGDTLGFRASYFTFNHSAENATLANSDPNAGIGLPFDVSTFPGAPFGSPGLILTGLGLGADQFKFQQDLEIHTVDLEMIKDIKLRSIDLQFSAGGRYMMLTQDYRATQTNSALGATEVQTVSIGRDFNGAGPTAALTGWNPLGNSGFSLYGSARMSLLVGSNDTAQNSTFSVNDPGVVVGGNALTSFNFASSLSDIIPTMELALGIEHNRTIGSVNLFGRIAVVDQTYFGAGNSFSDEGNLSLLGIQSNWGIAY